MITLNRARVMVTGGGGFLGSRVNAELQARGAVTFVPRQYDYDLRDPEDARRAFAKANADMVVHCAAKCGGIGANRETPADFCRDNLLMGINVLHEVCRRGLDKILIVGTTCSYPSEAAIPFRESALWTGYPELTNAPYGLAKLMLTTLGNAYRDQHEVNAITVIPTNLYGPGDNFGQSGHVIPHMICKFISAVDNGAGSVTLWGYGSPTRDFLYVDDAAMGIVDALAQYGERDPLNLGTGVETSIQFVAETVADACGYRGAIEWDVTKPNGQMRRCMDISRARDKIGFTPKTRLKDGIARTVKWYRENQCAR